jgi:hypothetical protein
MKLPKLLEPSITLSVRREGGGFITDFDTRGRPVGEANVETTSPAVLALDRMAGS